MTKTEYEAIGAALEKCREGIEKSFNTFSTSFQIDYGEDMSGVSDNGDR